MISLTDNFANVWASLAAPGKTRVVSRFKLVLIVARVSLLTSFNVLRRFCETGVGKLFGNLPSVSAGAGRIGDITSFEVFFWFIVGADKMSSNKKSTSKLMRAVNMDT
jgi:hypothetical protein